MQIAEQVQAEIMEIAADDQMKHAEAPSDEEMEQMFAAVEQDPDWAKERQMQELGVERMLAPIAHRPRYNHEPTSAENRAEQLAEIERGNVESSRTTNH
jgi:hypothetical protein